MRAIGVLKRAIEEFLDDNCINMAAAISYYVLLSLFPLTMAFASIAGFILGSRATEKEIVDAIGNLLPASRDFLANTIRGLVGARGATGALATVGLLWAGIAVFSAVRKGLNLAWGITVPRPFLQERLVDLLMMMGSGALLGLSLAGTILLRILRSHVVPFLSPEAVGLSAIVVSYLVPAAFTFLTFLVLYKFVPLTRTRWREVWLGALVASVGFEVVKNVFAWYVRNFASYNIVYGSLGAMMGFMVWVYFSAIILLFGAELSSVYARQKSSFRTEAAPQFQEMTAESGNASPSSLSSGETH